MALLRDFSTIFPDTEGCTYARDFQNSFELLDSIFGFLNCPYADHSSCEHNVLSWNECEQKITSLKELWKALIGESAITPYFHVTEFHIGDMISRSPYHSIAPFSLQSQELKHQVQTRIQFRKTNHGAVKKLKVKVALKPVNKKIYARKVPLGRIQPTSNATSNSSITTINTTIKPPKTFSRKPPTIPSQTAPKATSAFALFLTKSQTPTPRRANKGTAEAIIELEHARLWMTCHPKLYVVKSVQPRRLSTDVCKALSTKLKKLFNK